MSPKRKAPSLYNAVGRAVRDARTRRGLSLRALAAAIGVSPAFLSRIERGIQMPKPEFLHLCAKHLAEPELDRLASALSAASNNADVPAESDSPAAAGEHPDQEAAPAVEVARRLGIPIPWAEPRCASLTWPAESDWYGPIPRHSNQDTASWAERLPGTARSRMPPTLVEFIDLSAMQAEMADALVRVYRRAIDKVLPKGEPRDFLSNLMKHLAASQFAAGTRHGIETALAELKGASTYALYWALVPFMPPERAAWLHQLYFTVATAGHPAELQQAVLELAQLLAAVPAEELSSLLARLRRVICETLDQPEPPNAPQAQDGKLLHRLKVRARGVRLSARKGNTGGTPTTEPESPTPAGTDENNPPA